ncbi:MAG TPA: tetratricopeptide repeat protein [Candidatus Acidoferrum sp.]|nr:tetratricopeptide repeat protein [Candidatus Acidoferrum sp.]
MKIASLIREQKSSAVLTQARAGPPLSRLAACILAATLVAIVFAVYSPAANFQFVLDDHRFLGDPRLQSSGHVWEYFTSYVWAQFPGGPSSFYRPVFALWLRLNFVFAGASSWGWHLLSIAKHVSVAILLGLLVWKLLRDRVAALLAGTLFALHPAQTESVAWVTVPDPLMSAAILGSLLLYLTYTEHRSAENQPPVGKSQNKFPKRAGKKSTDDPSAAWIIASAALCLVALMAKETAIVLPAMIFAMALMTGFRPAEPFHKAARKEAAPRKRTEFRIRLVSAFRQTLPYLAVTGVYLLLRGNALKGHLSPSTQHLPWTTVLLSWPAVLWFYGKVLFWPVRSYAFADPILADTFSLRRVLLPGLGVGCAAAFVVAACIWAWRKARHDLPDREATGVGRALLLGVLMLVLPILPALSLNALNPGDFLHGRYTYLPLAGLMLLPATGSHLAKKRRMVILSAAGAVAVAFGVFTVKQESMWRDDLTVFTIAHQYAPRNVPVAQNLANAHVQAALALDEAGRCDQAMPIFEQVIEQYPQDWFAWAGRGECLFKLHDLAGAEQSLRRASELSHAPRVIEQWQELRASMGLPSAPLD